MTKIVAGLLGMIACACSSGPQANGQTGSPGYGCNDAECSQQAKDEVASLAGPVTPPTFVGSSCHPADTGPAKNDTRPTIYCRCDQSDGGVALVSHTSLGPGCLWRGRGGFCVFDTNDYQECDPADVTSCDATCSLLQSRLTADAAATHTASVRFSQCDSHNGRCGMVLEVDSACFVGTSSGYADLGPYDCALSNEQLLSQGGGDGTAGSTSVGAGAGTGGWDEGGAPSAGASPGGAPAAGGSGGR